MNHTKQDRLDALLVSAQIIQRQCKFARVDIEKYPRGGFSVVVFYARGRFKRYGFSKSMSIDELDNTFSEFEDYASEIEIALREKYL